MGFGGHQRRRMHKGGGRGRGIKRELVDNEEEEEREDQSEGEERKGDR